MQYFLTIYFDGVVFMAKKISILLCTLLFLLQSSKITFAELTENSFTSKLGDNSNVELWLFLWLFSLCGLLLICYLKIKDGKTNHSNKE